MTPKTQSVCGAPIGFSGYLEVYCDQQKGHDNGIHEPVAEPAPAPQEPPQRLEGDCSCDGDRRCIEHLFQERADAKARKDGNQ